MNQSHSVLWLCPTGTASMLWDTVAQKWQKPPPIQQRAEKTLKCAHTGFLWRQMLPRGPEESGWGTQKPVSTEGQQESGWSSGDSRGFALQLPGTSSGFA